MKKIIYILLTTILMNTIVFTNSIANAVQIDEMHEYDHKVIDIQSIPEDIIPLFFSSYEEANNFIKDVDNAICMQNKCSDIFIKKHQDEIISNTPLNQSKSFIPTRGISSETKFVTSYGTFPDSPYQVNLYCSYTTQDPNRGPILSCDAYTTFSYISLFHSWEEAYSNASIQEEHHLIDRF